MFHDSFEEVLSRTEIVHAREQQRLFYEDVDTLLEKAFSQSL
jgi:hypothetical protein